MILYADDELDFVSKMFNVGAGKAAASLGTMVRHDVALSVPNLSIIQAIDLVSELCMISDSVCGVFKRIPEPLDSYAVILLPKQQSVDLVRYVNPLAPTGEDHDSGYDDAITEIGNILIGACLGGIADTLGIPINLDQPVSYVEHPSEFFLRSIVVDDLCEYFLDIRLAMRIKNTPLTVSWDFLLPDNGFEFLKRHMAPLLAGPAS